MTVDRATRSIAGEGEALEIAGITDRGPVRTQNQDVWDAHIRSGGRTAVLALADGMGGHKGGLESAEAAVKAAISTLLGAESSADPTDTLRRAVAAANDAVAVARDSIGGNPGTTLVLAIISGTHASVANVGVRELMQLASDVATLDVLSDGRAVLGIGAGHIPREWTSLGRQYPTAQQRVSRLVAAVGALTSLLAGDAVTLNGEYAYLDGAARNGRLTTAHGMISTPASSHSRICATVASTSLVNVLVIVCTVIGASPPTGTLPTMTCRLLRR